MTYSEHELEFTFAKNLNIAFFRFVTMHAFDRQTDRQTDRNLIVRPRLHSMQRGNSGKTPSFTQLTITVVQR